MRRYRRVLIPIVAAVALLAAACGSGDAGSDDNEIGGSEFDGTLVIGAIPDQDPEVLARNYELLAGFLAEELGVEVSYEPVTEYDAAVTAFRVGDLDLVWFGGLTGVQARLQVDGAEAVAQRDIDEQFTSVFIAGVDTGIDPIDSVEDLAVVAGHTLTFGSDTSTSGRLMPQSFLKQAGVLLDDLQGEPGFSGSHDATIELVESGTFDVGALNSQVWESRVEAGDVDLDRVQLIFETPVYYDYHWVARPELSDELKADILAALQKLDPADPDQAVILEFFGAASFIDTDNGNYASIEEIGRESGLIDG
ncbi:MAG: putative selenate ABC transporter substrate-binding protein [Acidimicrobiia bacterium]|nr:putative selenate ABC transporter substrate-binding protein [Acidimicrobiia bacterium]